MRYGPGPTQPDFTMNNPLHAVNVSTGGVHPLVKASMLPRMKAAKQVSTKARASAMAKAPGVSKPFSSKGLSVNELRSRRGEVGRQPRA